VAEEDAPDPQPDASARPAKPEDNSLGRLLTLSDGVFAIAMTLLALDLMVPDLHGNVSDQRLLHALGQNTATYWSYLLSFYVIASYWGAHRRLMRSVVAAHPALIRDTIWLLLIVAAMPFPTSLLGQYAEAPFTLALYGAANALATLALIVLARDVRRCAPADHGAETSRDNLSRWSSWLRLAVFLLCIPAGYLFGEDGLYVLLLLIVTSRLATLDNLAHRYLLGRVRRPSGWW
jgi:uncharacterized membrane protein